MNYPPDPLSSPRIPSSPNLRKDAASAFSLEMGRGTAGKAVAQSQPPGEGPPILNLPPGQEAWEDDEGITILITAPAVEKSKPSGPSLFGPGVLAAAGAFALIDGPLPFGDVAAAGLLVGAGVASALAAIDPGRFAAISHENFEEGDGGVRTDLFPDAGVEEIEAGATPPQRDDDLGDPNAAAKRPGPEMDLDQPKAPHPRIDLEVPLMTSPPDNRPERHLPIPRPNTASGDNFIPTTGSKADASSSRSIADIAGRLTANPPLASSEKSELVALALGATPDSADSQRLMEVALAKIGLARVANDIPAARRAVQKQLGHSGADNVVAELSGSTSLAGLLRQYPEVGDAILTRPKTIEALGQHPQALGLLEGILGTLEKQDPLNIEVPTLLRPPQSILGADQIQISRAATASMPEEDYLRAQPGFDQAWRSDPTMISQYLNSLYNSAEAATPEFVSLVESLADATNGTAELRLEPKSRKRALDKIDKYDGDASRLTDLVAGRIVFDKVGDIYNALAEITTSDSVKIVEIDDRILQPQPSGYRDITMKLQMSNGHIAELRLESKAISGYAKDVDHALYEVYRDLAAHAKQSGTGVTDSVRFIMNSIRNETIPEYRRRFNEANTPHSPVQDEPR